MGDRGPTEAVDCNPMAGPALTSPVAKVNGKSSVHLMSQLPSIMSEPHACKSGSRIPADGDAQSGTLSIVPIWGKADLGANMPGIFVGEGDVGGRSTVGDHGWQWRPIF